MINSVTESMVYEQMNFLIGKAAKSWWWCRIINHQRVRNVQAGTVVRLSFTEKRMYKMCLHFNIWRPI